MAPRCQCDPECKRKPLKGQAFCAFHRGFCPIKAPLSGAEPAVGKKKYNKTVRAMDSHNCFAYALDHMDLPNKKLCDKDGCDVPFHQPGRTAGFPKWSKIKGKRCPDLIGRLKGDVPGIQQSTFTSPCPANSYKIAMVVDPKRDYHFYRQDADGMWSHKPGSSEVIRIDASNRPIYNPELADRDYRKEEGKLHYKHFCSYMCVPTKTKKFKRGGGRPTKRHGPSRRSTRRQRASQ